MNPANRNHRNQKGPQKFIGGAERARRQARSTGWEPPSQKRRRLEREEEQKLRHHYKRGNRRSKKGDLNTHQYQRRCVVPLSTKKLRSSERFFASLLEAPNFPKWNALFLSSGDIHYRPAVLEYICSRLGMGPVPSSGQSHYQGGGSSSSDSFLPHTDNPRRFFSSRAILVMEEARHELEEALGKQHHDDLHGESLRTDRRKRDLGSQRSSRSGGTSWTEMRLDSVDLDQKRTGFLRLGLLRASGRFSPEELSRQRPGSCFELEVTDDRMQTTNTAPTRVRMLCSVAPSKPGSFSNLVVVVYERASIDQLLLLLDVQQSEPEKGPPDCPQREMNVHSPIACAKVRWKIRFCVTLVSSCRQFEACDFGCASHRHNGGALLKIIMGRKEATHIRFCDSDDDEDGDGENKNDADSEDGGKIVGYITEESNSNNEQGQKFHDKNNGNSDSYCDVTSAKTEQEHSKLHLSMSSFTGLKTLNPTQEMAAEKFCSFDETKATLELIQGPPGTGKTTFVVSVLARLLCQTRGNGRRKRPRRILVTAPTNKAVGVIAKRFIESCPGLLGQHGVPISMIGVQDKLLEPDDDGTVDEGLKRIFCYTWLDTLAEEYRRLLEELSLETIDANHPLDCAPEAATKVAVGNRGVSQWLSKAFPLNRKDTFMVDDDSDSDTEDEGSDTEDEGKVGDWLDSMANHKDARSDSVAAKAKGLHLRLLRNLPWWSEATGAANLSRKLLGFLGDGDTSAASAYIKVLVQILKDESKDSSLVDSTTDEDIKDGKRGVSAADAVPELLATARVIFCTLSTAGTSLMKRTCRIDDWIVDEAAAATEPELLIPLHLDPLRLLVVGDPRQLPASVSSPLSERCGLGRSLHERLTVDLGRPQTMLDVQYRMKPEISKFPSHQFYGGNLVNGENVKEKDYGSSLSSCGGSRSNSLDLIETTPPFCFFQVNGNEQQSHTGSYYNTEEAIALVALLKVIRARYHKVKEKRPLWCSPDKIRVITFYSAQVAELRQILRKEGLQGVLVATVDSSQGCEADLVVLSFVRTTRAGFLRDDRRMNVALTRARHKLVCLGNVNESTWASGCCASSSSSTLTNLLRETRSRGCLSLSLAKKNHN